MRVTNCFDGWKKKAGVLRKDLVREFGVAGGNEFLNMDFIWSLDQLELLRRLQWC
jgi:hypothetical protein